MIGKPAVEVISRTYIVASELRAVEDVNVSWHLRLNFPDPVGTRGPGPIGEWWAVVDSNH